ncbi:hypothetical protein DFH06DRAFT_64496, partial [Mycena polygramma]
MPPQPSATQVRLNNITKCLEITAESLEVLSSGLRESSLEAISYTTRSLLKNIETIKQNKDTCIQLLEQTHELLNAILVTYVKSDTGADLPPGVLSHIAKFTETLHKVHTFIEAQQKGSKIRRLFRQGELGTLLRGCKEGLQQGLDSFQINIGKITKEIKDMQEISEERHQEVLHLIEGLSDASSDGNSTINTMYSGSHTSSASFTMLPSEPKIFHGRNSELVEILQLFSLGVPKIAILGAGGMGKTTVARGVLHHTQITTRYEQHRYFVPCDAANTKVELAALVGAHLGLKPGKDLTRAVVQHFSNGPEGLLILDNLETAWEPVESRNEIEEFLSLLTDVEHLALMVTMRGTQRPAKVAWTHPFLPPLNPLGQDAAHQTFIDIADAGHNPEDIDKVLALTDNMPLAISLLAHLVDSEGCAKVLSRWEEERTSMIFDGWDRRSNLDLSISMSLSSPRLAAFPHSRELLSLLSILPNGLSDADLVQSKLPIDNVLGCKAVLVGTSLAYTDSNKRLKALVPIREYMQKIQPPADDLIRPLRRNFQELLELYKESQGTVSSSGPIARISSNLANIQNVLQKGLYKCNPDLVDCIYCTCYLSQFSRVTSQGEIKLMQEIPNVFPQPCDHRLEAYFADELLDSWSHSDGGARATVISQTLGHLELCNDLDLKCSFYIKVAFTYHRKQDLPAALKFSQSALSVAILSYNTKTHALALQQMASVNWQLGHYSAAQANAKECQRLARISANLFIEAGGLHIEAMFMRNLGDYTQSLSLCNQARDLIASCGMSHSVLDHIIMVAQAEVHRLKSEYIAAWNVHQQILQETRDPWTHGFTLLNIAEIDVLTDAPKDAVQHHVNAAKEGFKRLHFVSGSVMCDATLANLTLREGNMLAAKALYLDCLSWGLGN